MEPKEQEKTLQERFSEFQSQVQALRQKPAGLEQELSVSKQKLERLRTARFSQLALDETAKAETLQTEILRLEPAVEILESKAAAFGPGGRESAQALVQNAPDSELYNLALSIVAEAAETAPDLEAELKEFLSYGAEKIKEEYLDKIENRIYHSKQRYNKILRKRQTATDNTKQRNRD